MPRAMPPPPPPLPHAGLGHGGAARGGGGGEHNRAETSITKKKRRLCAFGSPISPPVARSPTDERPCHGSGQAWECGKVSTARRLMAVVGGSGGGGTGSSSSRVLGGADERCKTRKKTLRTFKITISRLQPSTATSAQRLGIATSTRLVVTTSHTGQTPPTGRGSHRHPPSRVVERSTPLPRRAANASAPPRTCLRRGRAPTLACAVPPSVQPPWCHRCEPRQCVLFGRGARWCQHCH